MQIRNVAFLVIAMLGFNGHSSQDSPSKKNHTAAQKDLHFDDQLVEGKIRRPELSVVTGDLQLDGFKILRMTRSFADFAEIQSEDQR